VAGSAHAQRATEASHVGGQFVFREIQYANVRVLFGAAPKGRKWSRPEIHRDEHEVCWVPDRQLSIALPHEQYNSRRARRFSSMRFFTIL